MKQSGTVFSNVYRLYYVILLFILSIILIFNQICYESFIRMNEQIMSYLKQVGYQLNDSHVVDSIMLPLKPITTWYHPTALFASLAIFGLILLFIYLNEHAIKQERSFTICFMKNIFSPIILVFSSLLLVFILFQNQIEVLINHVQLYSINHVMATNTTLFSQLQEANNTHFTVKLPSTYDGLLQMNQLTNHEWTFMTISIVVKNMVLILSLTLLVYFLIYTYKTKHKSNTYPLPPQLTKRS